MKLLKFSILAWVALISNLELHAQTFDFKKGEVLDILLLTNKPDWEKHFEKYKETAFPVASEMSYRPLPGYYSISNYTQGNHQPEILLFGKWENIEKREKFIAEIDKRVPDFHKQRQEMWSYFGLTYYEMANDISFTISKEKYKVVTAYWKDESTLFVEFKTDWLKKSNKAGGEIILELTNGKSPFGYYHNPDYLVITQWENKAAFEDFYEENLKMDYKGVKHLSQFALN